ncbi:MAG: hypothetical protein V1822_00515 [Candidatus Micrarchaeota archaeon]
MKKEVGRLCGLYTDSLFFVLLVALVFLVFEALGPISQGTGTAGGVAYTANSLPFAAINPFEVIVIGLVGLLVVGMLFMSRMGHEESLQHR